MPDKDYYLIRGDMLPEVFVKVIRARAVGKGFRAISQ